MKLTFAASRGSLVACGFSCVCSVTDVLQFLRREVVGVCVYTRIEAEGISQPENRFRCQKIDFAAKINTSYLREGIATEHN